MTMWESSMILVLFLLFGIRSEDLCWSRFGDHQYKVLTPSGGALFSDAVDQCSSINTTLASIHSPEEDAFLEEFVMTQMSLPLWIGLRRVGQELEWMDGTPVEYVSTNYKPRSSNREGCIYLFMGWSEESCKSAALHFICKREVSDADACLTTTTFVPTSSTSSTTTKTQASTSTTTRPTATGQITSATTDAITTTTSDGNDLQTTLTEIRTSTTITAKPTNSERSLTTSNTQSSGETSVTPIAQSTERKKTFAEMLDEMTVKKKPVFQAIEGANSTAIGSVSIMILIGIVLGIILLDLNTIKNHIRMLKYNTKDVCKRTNKTDVTYLETPKVTQVKEINK